MGGPKGFQPGALIGTSSWTGFLVAGLLLATTSGPFVFVFFAFHMPFFWTGSWSLRGELQAVGWLYRILGCRRCTVVYSQSSLRLEKIRPRKCLVAQTVGLRSSCRLLGHEHHRAGSVFGSPSSSDKSLRLKFTSAVASRCWVSRYSTTFSPRARTSCANIITSVSCQSTSTSLF